MKVACLQMDVLPSQPDSNFPHAEELIRKAMEDKPDVLVLPESWDISFLPRSATPDLYAGNFDRAVRTLGALAKELNVNIVAGSVTHLREDKLYNTCCVFDRQGQLVATYDKTHLFSHAGEDKRYQKGDHLATFQLDGVPCGVIICYDVRFPELARTMCLDGMDVLFVVCQWPRARIRMMQALCATRAMENQMFVVCCDACGTAGEKVCGGGSAVFGPSGNPLAEADDTEVIITAECDPQKLQNLRESFPVFRDRRPELYRL
ncbi:MAG: carbon-nitrogen family hydrolase [Oscillospiraceae bacterium]|nr:carbon-nitrogen family hydrolase [Oscillospiraceae bacterium]